MHMCWSCTSLFSHSSLLLLWLLPFIDCCCRSARPLGHSPFCTSSLSLWLVSPPSLWPGDERTNEEPHSESFGPPPQNPPILFLLNTSLTHRVRRIYIRLDVRRGGHSCLYERTVDVGSVLYTIWAMMLTNCCVSFTGYAWSHVMCSAGAISALLFPLVCALCLHSECHFFLCCSVETACTLFFYLHTHTNMHTHCPHRHTHTFLTLWWCSLKSAGASVLEMMEIMCDLGER